MNQNIIIMKLLQDIISDKLINDCAKENNFIDTARKITIGVFFKYIFSACIFKWKSYREAYILGRTLGLPQLDFSSLSLKGKNIDYRIFKTMFKKLTEQLNRSEKKQLNKKMGKVIASVDSTLIKVKKGQWNWSPFNSSRDGVKLHIKMKNGISMPIDVEESFGKISDKSQLSKFYNNKEILICDRGYMKISQFKEMDTMKKKQFFIIRVNNNLTINEIGNFRKVKNGSSCKKDIIGKLGSKGHRGSFEDHEFRIIEIEGENNQVIRLVTNIRKLSSETIAELYKKRWEIETFFKKMKQEFKLGTPFGKTENAVFSYLYISLIAYIIEKYLYLKITENEVYKKYTFINFTRILKTDFSDIEFNEILYLSLMPLCNINNT